MAYRQADTHTYGTVRNPFSLAHQSETSMYHAIIYTTVSTHNNTQGPAATLLNCNVISGGIAMDTLHLKVIIALTWLITTHTKFNLDIFFRILT